MINEVDYDNPGGDSEEYIEVYNPTSSSQSLSSLQLVLVNGATGIVYATIDLSTIASTLAAGGYLVISDPLR